MIAATHSMTPAAPNSPDSDSPDSDSPDSLPDNLTDTVARLTGLLGRETALLRTMQTDGIETLNGEKARLADRFRTLVAALRETPPAAAARAGLQSAVASLQAAVAANAMALDAALHASQTFGAAVGLAVRGASRASQTYGRDGRVRDGGNAMPLACNRRF